MLQQVVIVELYTASTNLDGLATDDTTSKRFKYELNKKVPGMNVVPTEL